MPRRTAELSCHEKVELRDPIGHSSLRVRQWKLKWLGIADDPSCQFNVRSWLNPHQVNAVTQYTNSQMCAHTHTNTNTRASVVRIEYSCNQGEGRIVSQDTVLSPSLRMMLCSRWPFAHSKKLRHRKCLWYSKECLMHFLKNIFLDDWRYDWRHYIKNIYTENYIYIYIYMIEICGKLDKSNTQTQI